MHLLSIFGKPDSFSSEFHERAYNINSTEKMKTPNPYILLMLSTPLLGYSQTGSEKLRKIENRPPNIIYILTDDLGYGDVTAYNPQAKTNTPNIDRLALQEIRFTDAHSPCAVSTPTRYGILTGRYCWRSRLTTGVLNGYSESLIEKERTSVASLLKKKWITTAVFGKWHLGLDWVQKKDAKKTSPSTENLSTTSIVKSIDPSLIDFSIPPSDGPPERTDPNKLIFI
jgi:arylsulfatase A